MSFLDKPSQSIFNGSGNFFMVISPIKTFGRRMPFYFKWALTLGRLYPSFYSLFLDTAADVTYKSVKAAITFYVSICPK